VRDAADLASMNEINNERERDAFVCASRRKLQLINMHTHGAYHFKSVDDL
jgi:hypothetical protein